MNVQNERLNEQSLAEKLDSKILMSYGIPNNYFQEERFYKLDLDFMSLSRMRRVRILTKVKVNTAENPENDGAQ